MSSQSFNQDRENQRMESLLTKTFTEAEISIETLDAHLRDSGVVPYDVQPDCIRLRTENGIGFCIATIPDRKFVRFSTYLPLRRTALIDQKHALARRLNEGVFLPVFTVDRDEDLTVAYAMPYGGGGLIDFGAPTAVSAVVNAGTGSARR